VSSASTRLIIHERVLTDGKSERTWLEVEGGRLSLGSDGAINGDAGHAGANQAIVELGVLDAVMKRYGRPLAEDIIASGPTLELEGGRTLSLLRHRARYDVIAKDFLVYQVPGHEPVAELAASVTAALTYLVRPPTGD
jgi:hypothetical protein